MAKKLRTPREIERDELALDPPHMTVLSDRPLIAKHAHLDSLDLAVKLGPVYDILRHPDTQTPLSVAIYGDWGTGKTSAMKWLEGLLLKWNADGDYKRGRIVRPVWFYPWKYHDKDDVWRGLIAEVILASISIRGATVGRIKKAFKRFGLFLGRSFLHALTTIRLVSRTEANALEDIYHEFEKAAHPEIGYLNEFETTLATWIRETISNQDERMVIFIDDLDRCLPAVALQVLEALKLYLNIDDLIFVVGVDRVVIDQLIQTLYAEHGLDRDKSKYYLAKMFQVEVTVGPNEGQAAAFLDEQLSAIGEHTNQYWTTMLGEDERQLFRGVVLHLAQRNPREIKRLLNSVLIHGAGVRHVKDKPFTFAQGMQVYLVRKILDQRYTMGLTVDTQAGMNFFHRWSQLVRGGAERNVKAPEDQAAALLGAAYTEDLSASASRRAPSEGRPKGPYDELLTRPQFAHLRRLLADRDLGRLMQIEYPADTSPLAAASPQELPRGLIREALARQHRKKDSELTPEDYQDITELNLDGVEIDNLSPLQAMPQLESLDLSFTNVTDLDPLNTLKGLKELLLTKTPVVELSPLRALENLQTLSLAQTELADLRPLGGLPGLVTLSLRNTPISDITALAALEKLESLDLSATEVADISALAGLKMLRELSLKGTQVRDVSPLHRLSRLEFVNLEGCPVPDEAVVALKGALPTARLILGVRGNRPLGPM